MAKTDNNLEKTFRFNLFLECHRALTALFSIRFSTYQIHLDH